MGGRDRQNRRKVEVIKDRLPFPCALVNCIAVVIGCGVFLYVPCAAWRTLYRVRREYIVCRFLALHHSHCQR